MFHPERPLTVLQLTLGAVLGGVTRYICNLAKGLQVRGHQVIVGGAPGPWERLFGEEGLDYRQLPLAGGVLSLWRAGGEIARLVQAQSVDIIHCNFRRPLFACRLARIRGMRRVPLVYSLHLAPVPIGGVSHHLTGFGDLVIAPAEEGRRWVIESAGVDPERVRLIPHGVDTFRWHPPTPAEREQARGNFGLKSTDIVAAYVGRFEYPKNEDWVVDLALESTMRGSAARFLLCGDGPHAELLKDRVARESADRVVFTGYVDPLPVYHAADLLLLPSSIEGFAYVAAEAAACGVAVLRTKTAGWQETVVEGKTGRTVAIDKAAFISSALDLLDTPELLHRFGTAAVGFARKNLFLDQQIDQTITVYRKCLHN